MVSGTSKSFSLRVRCPYGDHEEWVTVHSAVESLEHLLSAPCALECPTHGTQMEFPLEGAEKQPEEKQPTRPTLRTSGKSLRTQRSSERKPFHCPVVVYGWSKKFGSFHENTTTVMLNSSGALVTLTIAIAVGETLFLVNKFTSQEQEVRVVYQESHPSGGYHVGVAFQRPIPHFWSKTRRNPRAPEALRVFVRGTDRNGNPFAQSSYTLDISNDGARLENLGYLTSPGEVIEVKRRWHGKARFRVAWIGQIGTSESNQIGICMLESGKLPWRSKVPTAPPAKILKKS